MQLKHQLSKLLAGISGSTLTLNDRDSCQFLCTNGLKCIIELVPNSVRALGYIPVKGVPENLSLRIRTLEKALSRNLALQQSSNTSLVFDERVNQLMLTSHIAIDECSLDDFDQWVSQLIQRSASIKDELDRVDLSVASANQAVGKPSLTPINQAVKQAVMLKI